MCAAPLACIDSASTSPLKVLPFTGLRTTNASYSWPFAVPETEVPSARTCGRETFPGGSDGVESNTGPGPVIAPHGRHTTAVVLSADSPAPRRGAPDREVSAAAPRLRSRERPRAQSALDSKLHRCLSFESPSWSLSQRHLIGGVYDELCQQARVRPTITMASGTASKLFTLSCWPQSVAQGDGSCRLESPVAYEHEDSDRLALREIPAIRAETSYSCPFFRLSRGLLAGMRELAVCSDLPMKAPITAPELKRSNDMKFMLMMNPRAAVATGRSASGLPRTSRRTSIS